MIEVPIWLFGIQTMLSSGLIGSFISLFLYHILYKIIYKRNRGNCDVSK